METWINEAISKWNLVETKLNSGASITDIEKTEALLNFKFPSDFKNLYLIINGFLDLDWQEHMFHFWPLEKIAEEFVESTDKNFIGFCDFFLSAHFIGFKKNRAGIFKMYSSLDQSEDDSIAQTFQEIVGMINSNDDRIY